MSPYERPYRPLLIDYCNSQRPGLHLHIVIRKHQALNAIGRTILQCMISQRYLSSSQDLWKCTWQSTQYDDWIIVWTLTTESTDQFSKDISAPAETSKDMLGRAPRTTTIMGYSDNHLNPDDWIGGPISRKYLCLGWDLRNSSRQGADNKELPWPKFRPPNFSKISRCRLRPPKCCLAWHGAQGAILTQVRTSTSKYLENVPMTNWEVKLTDKNDLEIMQPNSQFGIDLGILH